MVKPGVNTDLLEILNKRETKLRSDKTELLVKIDELENTEINVKAEMRRLFGIYEIMLRKMVR